MKKARIVPVIISLLCCLLCSGCWDRQELEDLGFILSLGIDADPDGIEMTAQIAIPVQLGGAGGGKGGSGGGGQGPTTQVVTKTAKSLPEAFKSINREVNRKLTLAQNRIIFFGEETARKGLSEYMSLFSRYREFRRTMQIMVVEGKAKDAMQIEPEMEKNPAVYLLGLVRMAHSTSETEEVTINDFITDMESLGTDPIATYILLQGGEDKQSKSGGGGQGAQSGGGEESKDKKVQVGGVAAFSGDRMIGVIDPMEVGSLLMLTNRFEESFYSIDDPAAPGRTIILHLTSARPSFQPRISSGRASLKIHIKVEADLVGTDTGRDYGDQPLQSQVERALGTVLKKRVEAFLQRTKKELKSDLSGIGNRFRALFPTWSDWKAFDWKRRYPELETTVELEVHLRRYGLERAAPMPLE